MSETHSKITSAYVSGDGKSVTSWHSTRNIDNSIPYLLPHFDKLASVKPGFIFLDVGCGPGSITLDVAARYPQATLLGVDGSEKVIEEARNAARERGLTNTKFAVGDALDIHGSLKDTEGFGAVVNSQCDIVHAHQVLQHTSDGFAVLKGMREAARPDGGLVAVREADWGMMAAWPETLGTRTYLDTHPVMMRAKGTDPLIGRKLVSLAVRAGFPRARIEASVGTWIYSSPEDRKAWANMAISRWKNDKKALEFAIERGLVKGDDGQEDVTRGWEEWRDSDEGFFAIPCPQIVCQRGD